MRVLSILFAIFALFIFYKAGYFAGRAHVQHKMFARCIEARISPFMCLEYVKDL